MFLHRKNQFLECVELAEVIIMNDAEWFKSQNFGITIQEIRKKFPNKTLNVIPNLVKLLIKNSIFFDGVPNA